MPLLISKDEKQNIIGTMDDVRGDFISPRNKARHNTKTFFQT